MENLTEILASLECRTKRLTPDRESTLAFLEEITIHRGRLDQALLQKLAQEVNPVYAGQVFSQELKIAGGGLALSALVRHHQEAIEDFVGKEVVEPFVPHYFNSNSSLSKET